MANQDPIGSKYWYGNALTLALFALAMLFAVLNIILDGSMIAALPLVIFLFASLGIGYLSIITFYLDTRRIKQSDTDYKPHTIIYLLGYLFTSPILTSAVYLNQRSKATGHPWGDRRQVPNHDSA